MRHAACILATVVAIAAVALPQPVRGAAPQVKVAIIVGPVGEELTPVYIELADAAAEVAETRGASVARAYSPGATPEAVIQAVDGANVVVYFGHGVGSPNPYSETPDPAVTNGWGLNGRATTDKHADSAADGTLVYRGEAWIAEHARPAPGWVMIYSNACYAPGAGEGTDQPATAEQAKSRVAAYSRAPLAELGASAYFATDFYEGAAELVGQLLDHPDAAYGELFAAESRYVADGVSRAPHPLVDGAETWLQRSEYFEGQVDYWYAFAGEPTASFAAGLAGQVTLRDGAATLTVAPAMPPLTAVDGFVRGMASSYPEQPGWEGLPTVALPLELGGGIPAGRPDEVVVCADRCFTLPVVDSCPCYVGTADQRIANLSHTAWRLVSDMPLEEGLIEVELQLSVQATLSQPLDTT